MYHELRKRALVFSANAELSTVRPADDGRRMAEAKAGCCIQEER
ncbi:MAG TPA: hypothetical protein VKB15_02295 [Xanthobacteraceae bacterium]|nr:hypothetical protein [Xanthobacteraceae bacterium]